MEILTSREGRRGINKDDEKLFSKEAIIKLQKAQEEIQWLLDRGYKINPIMELVGGKYQFSVRQINALKRSTSSKERCKLREERVLPWQWINDKTINIDGFNLIITLEVALSGGVLMLCNDGTIRDVAGLRGTYSIIDKTDKALLLIGKALNELGIKGVKFFLDAPVSNSGRLKVKILEHSPCWNIDVEVELVPNADPILSKMERVVTSDSIILDNCRSWFNLSRKIVEDHIADANIVNLSGKAKYGE